jgi:hypothetical protein
VIVESVNSDTKRHWNPFWLFGLVIVVGSGILIGFKIGNPKLHSYKFVTTNRVVDTWLEGKNKWSYYMLDNGERIGSLAKKARAELLPLGFAEDSSRRPWIRFVKGNEEIVLCYHNEFELKSLAAGGSKVVVSKRLPLATSAGGTGKWPTVLIKNHARAR